MSKATEASLSDLHGALSEALSTLIKSKEVTASELNVARQFLKDNKIECAPGTGGKFDTLVNTMATLTSDDEESYPN